MILGYDHIARELIIDHGNGSPELFVSVADLTVKVYGDEGALVVIVSSEGLDVHYNPIVPNPQWPRLETLGRNHWFVRLGPGRAID